MIKRLRQQERLRRQEGLCSQEESHLRGQSGNLSEERNVAFLNPDLPDVSACLKVSSRLEELAVVQQWFQGLLAEFSQRLSTPSCWVGKPFDQINLALAEGFTNAVRHAHADLPSTTPVLIECWVGVQKVEINIFDRGEPFDPDSLAEPKPGTLREGGYGWFLLRRLVDQVTHDRAHPEALVERVLRADSIRPSSPYAAPDDADLNQVRNCLKLVKLA